MCGIMGYAGSRPVVDVLLKGLKRLEYRGYDSAGIAVLKNGAIVIKKAEGKLENVGKLVDPAQLEGARSGIGHTRWATHGKPTAQNAHPHKTGPVVLVHNGIIENYLELGREIRARGHRPESETDSELFGFLVLEEMKAGAAFPEAVRKAFGRLEGSCSVVVMCEKDPGVIVGVRNGSPLVAALDKDGGAYLASDAQPLVEYTKDVVFLENGDMVVAREGSLAFQDVRTGKTVQRKATRIDWDADALDKQGFPHYMLKEIHEQPRVVVDTLNTILDRKRSDPFPLADHPGVAILKGARRIEMVACGTAWHAALEGKLWLERWARIPVSVDLASEFRYRDPAIEPGTVVIGVSQSGETADTLAVIRDMKARGVPTLALTNTRGSTISREAGATFYTSAGPEVGVAATKTFVAQMTVLFLWAGALAKGGGNQAIFDQVIRLPHVLDLGLARGGKLVTLIREIAGRVADKRGFFFIGRGYSFPIALEGALKLKEIAYVHAEGYAAGELKHGPIAMIDEGMVVVVLAPEDAWRDKTVSNLQEVKARGALIVGVGNPEDETLRAQCDEWIPLPLEGQPKMDESLYPFLMSPIVQLLSYEIALLKGTDIDQPRNLAKSVTVE